MFGLEKRKQNRPEKIKLDFCIPEPYDFKDSYEADKIFNDITSMVLEGVYQEADSPEGTREDTQERIKDWLERAGNAHIRVDLSLLKKIRAEIIEYFGDFVTYRDDEDKTV